MVGRAGIGFKYNPGFVDDEELRASFIVRNRELRLLLKIISENAGSSNNRHILLIGPRGAGKTTLARRVAAELRHDLEHSSRWLPVSFGEESYSITSTGEFWLEAVYHLSSTVHSEELAARYEALRRIEDEGALIDSALGVIKDYAHSISKRLILIVENLNGLLETQMSNDDAWSFRHALQNHNEIMLLATATASFDQIERDELALFEQFKVHHVGPLSTADCRKLWAAIAQEPLADAQVRPIQILTGGNPRLIRVLAEFAFNNVFADLVKNLSLMIDQYTDYFKGQLDLLPTSERKVFVALLEHWDPAITGTVAEAARMGVSQTSANLSRLERRGAIVKDGRHWQAAERLFNIYYLMRRRGVPSSRVRALVKFMTVYYAPDQLLKRVNELAHEACNLKPNDRQDHYYTITSLMSQFGPGEQRQALAQAPSAFFQDPNLPPPLAGLRANLESAGAGAARPLGNKKTSESSLRTDFFRLLDEERHDAAADSIAALRKMTGETPRTLTFTALLQARLGNAGAAEAACHQALSMAPEDAAIWMLLANVLLASKRQDEALVAARKFNTLDPDSAYSWELLARSLDVANLDRAEVRHALEQALSRNPKSVSALVRLAEFADEDGDKDAAERLFKKAIKVKPADLLAYGSYGEFLDYNGRSVEAERQFRQMTRKFPDHALGWIRLGQLVESNSGRGDNARAQVEKGLALAGDDAFAFAAAAEFYETVDDGDAADQSWQRAVQIEPENAELWNRYGRFATGRGQNEVAEQALLRAIEIEPETGRNWEALGMLLSRSTDRHLEAEKAFREAIQKAPLSCSPHQSLGMLFEQQDRFEEAESQFLKALEVKPSCGCALECLLTARTEFGGRIAGMESLLDALVEAHPTNARALLLRARFYWRARGDHAAAMQQLLGALSLGRGHVDVWRDIAALLVEISSGSDLSPAESLLDLIAEHRPCEHILNEIAWSLKLKEDPQALALAVIVAQHALNQVPDDWDVRHTLAYAQLDSGQFVEAISHLPKLIGTHGEPDFPELVEILIQYFRRAEGREELVLREIEQSERSRELEPIIVALKLKLGREVPVAAEILEVARDILARINAPEGEAVHPREAG